MALVSRTFTICAAAVSLVVLAAVPSSATTWTVTPTPGGDLSRLNAVSATAANNAWAVGTAYDFGLGAERTLIERWNGTSWSRVTSPNGSQLYNQLYGVDGVSATSAWAVGSIETAHGTNGGGDGPKKAAAWRWNGTAWSIVDLPKPANTPKVTGVDMLSATDAWAVGWYYESLTPTARGVPYTAHWNGSSWTEVDAPAPGGYLNSVTSVSGTSPTDVWAVGNWRDRGSGQVYHPFALHWNGSAWAQVTVPDPVGGAGGSLLSVKAISPADVWATGYRDYRTPAAFHYDGTSWTETPLPALGGTGNTFLYSVTATAPDQVWAVGYTSAGATTPAPLVMRWNGTAWRLETPPATEAGGLLSAVTAVPGAVLAVGSQTVFSSSTGSWTDRTLGLRGSGS
ncbi:hypothetical protein [Nonomuraea sp. NEAU-A123]|uniref:hypothetical protein n=1 Tax=Nonomuraea sp. NEAU-A123 TaxID=2839649 RepID=UPI001BE4DF1E|nr:hypothetical protein [Nonomuraea sp. NEAU-A123]MBT2232615.1 hypothetical protein [Nonomuraea sp. NEAU-A123]